jgi:hypothetical protein
MMGVYFNFRDMLMLHLMIGIGFAFVGYIWAKRNRRERGIFVFGGDPFSFGDRNLWFKWFAFAWLFEFVTSFFYVHMGMFYWEVAMSPIEAGLMTLGGFITDRIIEIWEMHPERPLGKRPVLFDIKQSIDPEVRRKRDEKIRRDYEEAIRGH